MPSLVEELLKEETPVQESSAVAALQAIEKAAVAMIAGRQQKFHALGKSIELTGDALDLAQIRDMARAGLKS